MTTKTFNKEDGKWYIDLPLWFGPKSALQMVDGADELMDRLSNNTNKVTINFSSKGFEGYDELLIRIKKMSEIDIDYGHFDGAVYKCKHKPIKNEILTENNLWLCGVTLFVFGRYPKEIYIQIKK